LKNKSQKDIKNDRSIRKKIKREHDEEDFEDYNEELRLVKKLRKGQITI
jgi:hypothetical protein